MDINQNSAVVGVWTDHETGESLLSVKSPWGIIIVALAGIWISWCTKYVKKIIGNIALWIHLHLRKQPQQPHAPDDPSESTSLLSHSSKEPMEKHAQALAKLFKEKSGIRDLVAESLFSKELTTGDKLRLLLFTLVVALAASGFIVGGYFLAKIRVDGPNLLASDRCGLWLFEGHRRTGAATRARMLDLGKEERAAQLAEDCYGRSGSIASRCNVFYKPYLPVSGPHYNWGRCPFKSDICLQNMTVTFKTPLIDAQDLGINSLSTPKFRRINECTPLSMEYPYIQNQTENGTTTFTYYYGPKQSDGVDVDYTYKTVGSPWDRVAPVYDVFAYSSNADLSDHPVWKPHPDLTIPKYSTITIVFVSSLRILYSEHPSSDPIFPADEKWYMPGDPIPWYRNSDPRARPFACVNTIEVCAPEGQPCWNVNKPTWNSTIDDNSLEYILLYSALYKTDIYYSLAKRQGRALLAQKKVSQYFSTPLSSEHWVSEVQNLVWTALARTSMNAWSVASGEDSVYEGKDGFIEKTKGYGNLCNKYKYRPRGYQSIRWAPLKLLPSFLLIIWVLSLDWYPIERRGTKVWNVFRKAFSSVMTQTRAQGIRARRNMATGATIQPAAPTNNQLPPATAIRSQVSSEEGPDASSQRQVSASNTNTLPADLPYRPNNNTREQATASDAEARAINTTQRQQQRHEAQNTVSLDPTSSATDASDTSEDKVEWEPLVWHKLIYLLLWIAVKLVTLLVKAIWFPLEFFCRTCRMSICNN